MTAEWAATLPALAGVALGGGFSYLVMRGQVSAEREQRKHDRLSQVIADYWAAIDQYATASEELYVATHDLMQAREHGEPVEEHQRLWDEWAAKHRAAKASCRELLGKVRIFFPELELCATELLLACGPIPAGYESYQEEERDEKLRTFEAAARESLGVQVRPGTEFFVPGGK
jgi:hypothetical protein